MGSLGGALRAGTVHVAFWCALVLGLLLAGPARAQDGPQMPEGLEGELLEWEPERKHGPRLPAPEWSLRFRNGIFVRTKDGRHEILVRGRVLLDGGLLRYDPGLLLAQEAGWVTEGRLRQARLGVRGVVFGRFLFSGSFEFEDYEVRDLYVGMRGLGRLGTLTFGQQKEPFSLEWATSFLALTFMERSLAQALVPGRSIGVLATNTHFGRRLRWAIGGFSVATFDQDSEERLQGLESDWGLATRITGLLFYEDEGRHLLNVGASYSHTFVDGDAVSLSSRPESFLADRLLSTAAIADPDDIDRLGLEAAWVRGPLLVQAEWIGLHMSRATGGGLSYWGGYLQASRFLTGEHRVYGRRSGVFGRVVPRAPFSWSRREWGALEIAARLSYLDLEDGDVPGNRGLDVTLGVNWYLRTQIKIMLNGIWGRVFDEGDVWIAQARLQLDF